MQAHPGKLSSHCAPRCYVVDCGKSKAKILRIFLKSTIPANESRYRLTNDQWTGMSEPVSVEEPEFMVHPTSPHAPSEELLTISQTLPVEQYITRTGRVVKPPISL